MSQEGLTLVETLLAVVILFFLSSTIIPLTFNMKQQIAIQKVQAHAAEVAFIGAMKYKRFGQSAGVQHIDGVQFQWNYDGYQVCVHYDNNEKEEELCV
ncbi:type II secretion system protein [Solibacillus isronensis]|uniref:type II secretion system protein n=1 Tax=Solibacillus isronensis TaxID=412383 RepID=UPI00203F8FC3|nr:type II secretion system protein [Solibacillus isronensis]MCM3720851.1 type II secretion system GspH family protein [Solibacillus isronensis]